ncbi:thioredoxin family protein [Shivajiella indica]|uniref:Thioredoxin family protein n=1 Tax=Shivajiella indica TaxID=872115 RepID=A0ABW5B554_9BACT
MNKIFALFFVLILFSGNAYSQEKIQWLTFEQAAEKTASNPKMVFVDVYTDWCGWCKKMDKDTFSNPEVIAYINANFYPVKMNAEDTKRKFSFKGRDYTEAAMARAMRVNSYPNFIIMDAAMENITQYPGYREADPFLKGLTGIMDKFGRQ